MQDDKGKSRVTEARGDFLRPVPVLTSLFVFLVASLVVTLMSGDTKSSDSGGSAPRPTTSTDFALSDTEAIERLKELQALLEQAYRTEDLTLLSKIFTTTSPAAEVAAKEIRILARSEASDKTVFESKSMSIVSNETHEIVLEEDVTVRPKFVDSQGQDMMRKGEDERQRVRWTLKLQGAEWFIEEPLIVKVGPP